MYYRETSICISPIILCYCDILMFYISVIWYLIVKGYKCRLTTFPTRFAHVFSILWYCHCSALMQLLCHEQMNKYYIISYQTGRICHFVTKNHFSALRPELQCYTNTPASIGVFSCILKYTKTKKNKPMCPCMRFHEQSKRSKGSIPISSLINAAEVYSSY